jgi:hypothetical protein
VLAHRVLGFDSHEIDKEFFLSFFFIFLFSLFS